VVVNPFAIPAEIRRWVILGCIVVALCLAAALLTMCHNRDVSQDRTQTANATGKALDNVAAKTEDARQSQTEKQNEVSQIPGANDRLPDGFGAELECVRRNCERRNP
jgi:hypothetical protein